MVVDFELVRYPALRVLSFAWKGRWEERRIRREFERLARWAAQRRLRTGRWILLFSGNDRFRVALEVRGRVRGEGEITVRRLPPTRVARVRFDPALIPPRVVYHGLSDWLRWRRKDKSIRSAGAYREVYPGNPWTKAKAWAATEVQVVVR